MFVAPGVEFFHVVLPPFGTGGMVAPMDVHISIFFQEPLPYGCRGARIVIGVGDIVKSQIVRFPFHGFGQMDVPGIGIQLSNGSAGYTSGGCIGHLCQYRCIQGFFHALDGMVFLAMAQFMANHHCDFIIGGEQIEDPLVYIHIVSDGAVRVGIIMGADEIMIGFLVYRRIHGPDSRGYVGHNGIQTAVQILIVHHPFFFLHMFKPFLPAFVRVVVRLVDPHDLVPVHSPGNGGSQHIHQHAAGFRLRSRYCSKCSPQPHQSCQDTPHHFLLPHFHLYPLLLPCSDRNSLLLLL